MIPFQTPLGNAPAQCAYYWPKLWVEEKLRVGHTHGHDQLPLVGPLIR